MKIPVIEGIIDRRILINFIADPNIVKKIIPNPFQPKLYKEKAIVGICLIRFKQLRPKGLPKFIGMSSENAAHRFAVEWSENNETKTGVYIPRRDSSSYFNTIAGGRIFPGKHFHANFDVQEINDHYRIAIKSSDGTSISVDAEKTDKLNKNSIFETLENASEFFETGSVGYSPNQNKFEGLQLKTLNWKIEPLIVTSVHSSFFENEQIFPKGTIAFDNALLMTQIKHEWYSAGQKECLISP
jgi:hypothetical protein